jgi:hypothetical protein
MNLFGTYILGTGTFDISEIWIIYRGAIGIFGDMGRKIKFSVQINKNA